MQISQTHSLKKINFVKCTCHTVLNYHTIKDFINFYYNSRFTVLGRVFDFMAYIMSILLTGSPQQFFHHVKQNSNETEFEFPPPPTDHDIEQIMSSPGNLYKQPCSKEVVVSSIFCIVLLNIHVGF